ncbi:UDP-N-acetylmuramate dehydrogenase [Thalassomonas viridans]|uniref:UDP-N-acetylenolpyruvoylglucosamine reductase n=1 Tax=Thalassomonas viridans TaxID=137584 RepID=A0AAE9Z5U2_9GAMM|nr:UDP-N-acetylmuramate dehydrogenase [Thalassomonas viridans]WDE05687.1 UDP-N-acetylmuramate dehydrogenase [Thalassomonas viridans]
MKSASQFQLKQSNSFNVASITPFIYQPASYSDLHELAGVVNQPFYILGEGSNTLFVEDEAPVIIRPDFKGIDIEETGEAYLVRVGAAENWHQLVTFCIEQGIYGLENLALIPGSVGAAPIQNIGAYGVEFADYCHEVEWFEFNSQSVKKLSRAECKFGYRDSIFKRELYNQGLIISVSFMFPKAWQAKLSYHGLDSLPEKVSAMEVMEQVIAIRESKLPDPDVLPNAGSFFKNPVIAEDQYQILKQKYPDMPFYPQDNKSVKLAAGWLIEHAGLKGFCRNGAGVHDKQALVLVNKLAASGKDISALAKYVQTRVLEKFGIELLPEVRIIAAKGEVELEGVEQ